MDVMKFLCDEIDKDVRAIEEDIASGKAVDFGDYKFHCGRVRGMLTAKNHIIELVDRLRKGDEEDDD